MGVVLSWIVLGVLSSCILSHVVRGCKVRADFTSTSDILNFFSASSVEFEESLEEKQMLLLTRELDPLESHSRVSHSAGVEDSLVVSVLTPSASIYVASPVAFSVNIGLASHCHSICLLLFSQKNSLLQLAWVQFWVCL